MNEGELSVEIMEVISLEDFQKILNGQVSEEEIKFKKVEYEF